MYRFRYEHAISRMAKVIKVSESGYYKWLKRQNTTTLKDIENIEIEKEILEIYHESEASFGIRKITAELNKRRSDDKKINHKRVERIMKENNIHARASKKYVVTTDSSATTNPSPNLLERNFESDEPGEKLVSDTTFVITAQGTLYVAVILDLYGRMPLGLAMSRKNDTELVSSCFRDVILRHKLKKGCVLHSDRGSTYASKIYRDLLEENNVQSSMSKKGDCWDNAPMESFFGKLKTEWLYRKPKTINEAKLRIYQYVWEFYTKKRPHETNNYMTPHEIYYGA